MKGWEKSGIVGVISGGWGPYKYSIINVTYSFFYLLLVENGCLKKNQNSDFIMSLLLKGICNRLRTPVILKTVPLKVRLCNYMNLSKDVTIFVKDSTTTVNLLSFMGVTQWFILTYNSFVFAQHLPAFFSWIPTDPTDVNLDSKRIPRAAWTFRYAAGLFLFSTSTAVLAAACIFSGRSVHSITLLKASDKVVFKTYTPIATLMSTTARIPNVSALGPRARTKQHLPIKVKNTYFNFMVDLSGDLKHPTLFDRTVGATRDFGVKKK